MKEFPDCGTLVPNKDGSDLTMIAHTDCGTLVPDNGTMVELQSNLGTMVINSDSEESTMKRHDTNPDKPKYRPLFLEHFDKKEAENNIITSTNFKINDNEALQEVPKMQVPAKNTPQQIQQMQNALPSRDLTDAEERQRFQSHLQLQLNQISAIQTQQMIQQSPPQLPTAPVPTEIGDNLQHQLQQQQYHQQQADNLIKYRMNALDNDYEFVRIFFYYFENILFYFLSCIFS